MGNSLAYEIVPLLSEGRLSPPGKELIGRLSFSHFVELLQFDEPVQRAFYEVECIRGNWSVRELKRQIGSLYYERSGLSRNKKSSLKWCGNVPRRSIPQ
jgi:hypothetical protein